MLHADADVRVGHEGPVEADDVYARAVVHDLELPQDLLPHRGFSVDEDELGTRRVDEKERSARGFRPNICLSHPEVIYTSRGAYLPRHIQPTRPMEHLRDGASVPASQLSDDL